MLHLEYLPQFEWFRLFYGIAILTGLFLVVRAALKDRSPVGSVLGIFLWVTVFGIFFSKALEWPADAWSRLFTSGEVPADLGKTALGGLVGGILGLTAAKWLSGMTQDVWKWFLAWPVVLILFRFGCLLAGCCIGTPTDLPWGVTYGFGAPIAGYQLESGHLHGGESCTLPAHPAPIYEILFGLAVLLFLYAGAKRNHSPKAMFLGSVAAYAGFRFLEEFIRPENATEHILNPVQWGLLAAIPVLLIWAWIPTKRLGGLGFSSRPFVQLLFVGIPFGFVIAFKTMWTPAEIFGVGIVMLAFTVAKVATYLKESREAAPQWWMAPLSLVFSVALMSQAAIDQTHGEALTQTLEIGAGGNFGMYQETCGPTHRYWNAGAGAVYRQNWSGKHQLDFGLKAYYAYDRVPSERSEAFLMGGNPYVEYQHRWFGAQFGLHVGDLMTDGDRVNLLPSVTLRLGPSDIFFAEGRINSIGFSPIPASRFHVGIGSGFGIKNGTVVRVGLGESGFHVHPSIVIKREFVAEPYFAYGDAENFHVGMNLRWRLPMFISKK